MKPLQAPVGEAARLIVRGSGVAMSTVVDLVEPDGNVLLQEPVLEDGAFAERLPTGTEMVLTWTSPAGRHELDVVMVNLLFDPVPLWRTAPEGSVRTSQLRRYARAADALGGTVWRGADSWLAVVADLGEGGARCVVVDTQDLRPHDQVVLRTTVDEEYLRLPALVLEVESLEEGRSQLRLQFGEIGRAADIVRRRVMSQQMRARSATV